MLNAECEMLNYSFSIVNVSFVEIRLAPLVHEGARRAPHPSVRTGAPPLINEGSEAFSNNLHETP